MGARLLVTQICVTESTEVPVAAGGVLPDHVLHQPGPGKSSFTFLSCHQCLFLQASSLLSVITPQQFGGGNQSSVRCIEEAQQEEFFPSLPTTIENV